MRACLLFFFIGLLLPTVHADHPLAVRGRSHWAFQPLTSPSVPVVRDRTWIQTPLDAFILAKLESAKLAPNAPADRRTLLRRVYLDLVGLPPTPQEQTDFLVDTLPDAYRRVVDRLLASPAYGERWGRHWLDVARYADTNGYERDGDKPMSWRYRDWVIDALNRDLGYDRFVMEQIAGDELPRSDASMQIATTFLRLGTWDDEPANAAIDRADQLDDVLGVTCAAFLAQTLRCARCHDHVFEPYTQKDYYRLLSVFTPLKRPQKERDDLSRPVGTREELDAWHRQQSRLAVIEPQINELKGRIDARNPHRTPLAAREKLHKLDGEAARLQHTSTLPRAYIWYEEGPIAPETRLLRRGNPELPGAITKPGLPPLLAPTEPPPPTPFARSTGHRLWLAKWVATPENPLTARVMVNRLWQWHFGRGLVATASDFGLQGDRPTHSALLDWLASELIRSGWSLKHVHRLIVLSSTYQISSVHHSGDEQTKLALYGRWRHRRLEAETVRDSVLAVSGQLHREMTGPGVFPSVPVAVLATQSRPGSGWGRSEPTQASRRSVYVFAKRSLIPPELELLDLPDSTTSCESRPRSTTAPQAVTFLNGLFTNEQAKHFAHRLRQEAGKDVTAQIRLAYTLALCREPRAEEVALIRDFIDRQSRQMDRTKALASFCLILLNTNEFFYPG